ncbi:MAG: hypothetical protein O3A51_00440 [Verrucomicrobia bacterium]|nr:hypothetical protein [Verrucomicrobiota bacterium]
MPYQLTAKDREFYLDRAIKAADWFVNVQIQHPKPWYGDNKRFPYYYNMKVKQKVPGLNWTHGRALFVLSEAFKLTKNKAYVEAANRGAEYIAALQVMDPHFKKAHGTIKEEIPAIWHSGILDASQAASGLLMLGRVSRNREWLRRADAYCECMLRHYRKGIGLPNWIAIYPKEEIRYQSGTRFGTIGWASEIPLWHQYKRTGDKRFLNPVVDAADNILKAQRADGGINFVRHFEDGRHVVGANHHWGFGKGKDRYLLRNDDGIVVVVLGAYQATKSKKYLDAMVNYMEWTVAQTPAERPYNAFGVQANNVLDIGRVSGLDRSAWVLDNLKKRCLDLQVIGSKDRNAEGGFRGEDEEGEGGVFGGKSLDYVVTRTTCYMAGTLFRLSGKGTGTGFSVFGLDRVKVI